MKLRGSRSDLDSDERLILVTAAEFAELAVLRADNITLKRDRDALRAERDDWRRQAMLLADRRAELAEEVRRASALKPRVAQEPVVYGGDV